MRIPTYDAQLQPQRREIDANVPRYDTRGLDSVINSLDSVRTSLAKDEQEKLNNLNQKTVNEAELSLLQKRLEIEDRLRNGGDYSNAVEEYKAHFNEVKSSYSASIFDESLKERAVTAWEKEGLETSIRLSHAVKQRAKADARASLQAYRQSMLERSVSEASPNSALSKISERFAEAEASGIVNDGKAEMESFMRDSSTLKVERVAQESPEQALEMAKKDPLVSEDIQARLERIVEQDRIAQGVVDDVFAGKASVRQPDIDNFYNLLLVGIQDETLGTDELVTLTTSAINTHYKVPTAIKRQVDSFMETDITNVNDGDVKAFDALSAMYDNLKEPAKEAFDKEQQAFIEVYQSQVNSGIEEGQAFRNVLNARLNVDDLAKDKDKWLTSYRKESDPKRYLERFSGSLINDDKKIDPRLVSDFENMVFTLSKNGVKNPEKMAFNNVQKVYGVYGDDYMKYAPSKYYGLNEKDFATAAIKPVFEASGLEYKNNSYKIMSDRVTQSQVEEGLLPTYPIYSLDDFGTPVRLVGRTLPLEAQREKVETLNIINGKPRRLDFGIVAPATPSGGVQ